MDADRAHMKLRRRSCLGKSDHVILLVRILRRLLCELVDRVISLEVGWLIARSFDLVPTGRTKEQGPVTQNQ
jgi:hypothetical protein